LENHHHHHHHHHHHPLENQPKIRTVSVSSPPPSILFPSDNPKVSSDLLSIAYLFHDIYRKVVLEISDFLLTVSVLKTHAQS
jgi:hypothetical protein